MTVPYGTYCKTAGCKFKIPRNSGMNQISDHVEINNFTSITLLAHDSRFAQVLRGRSSEEHKMCVSLQPSKSKPKWSWEKEEQHHIQRWSRVWTLGKSRVPYANEHNEKMDWKLLTDQKHMLSTQPNIQTSYVKAWNKCNSRDIAQSNTMKNTFSFTSSTHVDHHFFNGYASA